MKKKIAHGHDLSIYPTHPCDKKTNSFIAIIPNGKPGWIHRRETGGLAWYQYYNPATKRSRKIYGHVVFDHFFPLKRPDLLILMKAKTRRATRKNGEYYGNEDWSYDMAA